jgi:hypothetical protein
MSEPIVSNLRRSTIRAFCLGIITGSFLTASMVLLAGPARADTDRIVVSYAAMYGGVVCTTLAQFPTYSGVTGIGQAIAEDGLTLDQAGEVMWMSVANICPEHTSLLMRYAARFGTDLA